MDASWENLILRLREDFSSAGDIHSILFLVGIQESGRGFRHYDQQEKTDLIKLGEYTLLARSGYFQKITIPGRDSVFIPVDDKTLPTDPKAVSKIVRQELLAYFKDYMTKRPQ